MIQPYKRLLLHLVFWSALAFIFFEMIGQLKTRDEAIVRTVVNVCWLIFTYYLSGYLTSLYYERKKFDRWLKAVLTFVFLFSAIRFAFEVLIIKSTVFTETVDGISWRGKLHLFFFFCFFSVLFFTLSSLYFIGKKRKQLEANLQQAQYRHIEAELSMLKAQLNPHFLFNTLNSIYAAATLGSSKTPDMILRLSELLRYVTYTTHDQKIDVLDELEQVKHYIALYQLKSPQPLPVQVNVGGCLEGVRLPPMLLLPLIENALKHGNIFTEEDGVFIDMAIRLEGQSLYISSTNSYDESQPAALQGGVGIRNLKQRLELEYPQRHHLSIQNQNNIYQITLRIDHE